MTTPAQHAEMALDRLETAETSNHTDPRAAQYARLAQAHALLGIYGMLEYLATPRLIVGAEVPNAGAPLFPSGPFMPAPEDDR
jgi:hypothetical protein